MHRGRRQNAYVIHLSAAALNFANNAGDSSSGFSGTPALADRRQARHDIIEMVWDAFETVPDDRMAPRQDLMDAGHCLAGACDRRRLGTAGCCTWFGTDEDGSGRGLSVSGATRLRGAVFGCGMIAEYHLKGWRRIPEVEVVALGDRVPERAERRRAEFAPAARVYGDLPALLAGEPLDFIDILTPPAAHAEHCRAARAAGLHVICQKPLCDTLDGARRLAAAFAGSPRLFAVHENHRDRPWFRTALRLAREGAFGTIRFLRLEHHADAEPAEAYKLQAETGVWLEYGTHLVDMMRALLGEPRRVYARTHAANPAVRGESLAHAVFEYPHATAVIDVAWKPAGLLQGGALIEGERGEAYYEGTMTRGEAARFRVVRGREVVADESRSPTRDYEESFYLFERACADAMLGGPPTVQTAAEGLRTLACTFAAYEAARGGVVIDLGEFMARDGPPPWANSGRGA